ncbi:hypothetical protein ACFLWX_04655, partial [Chloroflexota bacterium]
KIIQVLETEKFDTPIMNEKYFFGGEGVFGIPHQLMKTIGVLLYENGEFANVLLTPPENVANELRQIYGQ